MFRLEHAMTQPHFHSGASQTCNPNIRGFHWIAAIVLIFLIWLTSTTVLAHGAPTPSEGQTFLLLGMDNGITDMVGPKYFLGAEISATHFIDDAPLVWLGRFSNIHAVSRNHAFLGDFRFAVGPQFGVIFFGVELGFLGEKYDNQNNFGVRVGVVAPLAFIAIYGRYGHLWGTPAQHNYGEIGLLLKIPFVTE